MSSSTHDSVSNTNYSNDRNYNNSIPDEQPPDYYISTHPTSRIEIPPDLSLSGIYSSTGFDLLRVLTKVSSRPNPVIKLGPVDLSCAFVVSDMIRPDQPIVYASETFEKLTGYSKEDIIGKNCRFLQSPTGNVQTGVERTETDNTVVKRMKEALDQRKECQFTLVNYKKNGQPFINLVTMIPISMEPGVVNYMIGFQVDLIDQPKAIIGNLQDGIYNVNYRRQTIQLPLSPEITDESPDIFFNEHSESAEDMLDHEYSILEEMESFAQNMEYRPEELFNHSISDYIHPADNIAVMRELRASNNTELVNLIVRIRRKTSGYAYMEMMGRHYEDSSVRRNKCFIFSARERPISSLTVDHILVPDTMECWFKLSNEGLILWVDVPSKQVFGYESETLFGMSLLDFVHDSDQDALKSTISRFVQSRGMLVFIDTVCRVTNTRTFSSMHFRFHSSGVFGSPFIYLQVRPRDPLQKTNVLDLKQMDTLDYYHSLFEQGNLLDIISCTRTSSLLYEHNQLRVINKKLKEEIDMLVEREELSLNTKCQICNGVIPLPPAAIQGPVMICQNCSHQGITAMNLSGI